MRKSEVPRSSSSRHHAISIRLTYPSQTNRYPHSQHLSVAAEYQDFSRGQNWRREAANVGQAYFTNGLTDCHSPTCHRGLWVHRIQIPRDLITAKYQASCTSAARSCIQVTAVEMQIKNASRRPITTPELTRISTKAAEEGMV